LTGWEIVQDPADVTGTKKIMKYIFGGTTNIPKAAVDPDATVWAVPFAADANFNTIKIESGDGDDTIDPATSRAVTVGTYSKLYKLDPNSSKTKAQQILAFFNEDFLVKYNPNIDALDKYREKLIARKGFNLYINDVAAGSEKRAVLDYDGAFHVETFTFDMRKEGFSDLEIRTQDFDTTGAKWLAFIAKVKADPAAMAVEIDKYNENDVIPKLKCNSPCYNCFDADPNFCTACWGNKGGNKKTYLQYRSIRDPTTQKLDV